MRTDTRAPESAARSGANLRAGLLLGLAAVIAAFHVSPAIASELPDFSGVWFSVESLHHESNSPDKLFHKGVASQDSMRQQLRLREPYAGQYRDAAKHVREVEANFDIPVDGENQCLPDGMPKMMRGILPIEILHTPTKIIIITEEMSQVRRIFLDGEMPPLDEIAPSYAGFSVGHWKGETLVVDTVAILPEVSFANIPNSGHVRLTERIRLSNPNHLEIRITYEDPAVLEEPHTIIWNYERHDDHRILEYVCDANRYKPEPDGTQSLIIDFGK